MFQLHRRVRVFLPLPRLPCPSVFRGSPAPQPWPIILIFHIRNLGPAPSPPAHQASDPTWRGWRLPFSDLGSGIIFLVINVLILILILCRLILGRR